MIRTVLSLRGLRGGADGYGGVAILRCGTYIYLYVQLMVIDPEMATPGVLWAVRLSCDRR